MAQWQVTWVTPDNITVTKHVELDDVKDTKDRFTGMLAGKIVFTIPLTSLVSAYQDDGVGDRLNIEHKGI